MRWIDEISRAFEALGGAARYVDLYEYIARTTDRSLSREWKATVRRTIEDHSSDSLNHRSDDLFQKIGLGHWGIRGQEFSQEEIMRRERLSPQEIVREVFVQEHWRSAPRPTTNPLETPDQGQLTFIDAWLTNTLIEVEIKSGSIISSPITWFPKISETNRTQRSNFEITPHAIIWPDLNEEIDIKKLLFGPLR